MVNSEKGFTHPRVGVKDVVWAYAAQIMQFGSSLMLLPLVLRRLSGAELGMWYVYTAIWSFTVLLDTTFNQTILRNVAYVYSGARILLKTGVASEAHDSGIDYELLFHVDRTCRRIYAIIGAVSLVILSTVGTYYVVKVGKEINLSHLLISWALFGGSVVYRLWYSYLDPLLMGSGKMREENKCVFYSRLASFLGAFILVLLGLGLVGVAAANMLSNILGRVLANRYYYTKELRSTNKGFTVQPGKVREIFTIMWHNSWRTGVLATGTFFLTKSSTFLASIFLDLRRTAQIGLCVQIADLLTVLSSVLNSTYLPEFTALRKLERNEELIRKFSFSWLFAMTTYLAGSVAVLVMGGPLLSIIKSNTSLLETPAFALLLFTYLLGLNHVLFANLISAKNEMPFVVPGLVSGVGTLVLTAILLRFTKMVDFALVLSQFLVQLAYNNWKWPAVIFKEYKISILDVVRQGFGVLRRSISGLRARG